MNFLSGNVNPFGSEVGQLIDAATDISSPEENVGLYFEICDMINLREDVAKDAMRAIRKKIVVYAGKNWLVVMKLLNLLEICSNNCNRKFQLLLANKDFLNELKSMIGPKLNPPIVVQEKVLALIKKWAQAHKNDHEFKAIDNFYLDLITKGIEFPTGDPPSTLNATDLELATDLGRVQIAQQGTPVQPAHPPQAQNLRQVVPDSAAAVRLNEEQIAKLKSELDIVDNNILVMNEVLTEHQPSDSKKPTASKISEDISLLQELFITTSEMQKRVTQLIGNIANDDVIGELLRVNDDLNNVFVRYERFKKGSNFSKPAETDSKRTPVNPPAPKVEEKSLIDFGDDSTTSTNDIKIDLLNANSKISGNSSNMLKTQQSKESNDENAFLHDENEIAEMENWLKTQELEQQANK